ncbi:NADH dehydrogenase [ubiquinone] 1 alpha subcomplex assembly factor 2 isoform X3 [Hemicordylus capensis]|uniref:NADH dehydrogenase [ubiquinone] 1 alpha subcomplex assembly factor 2 isoform X3 n=1 Tax=Hemicordylus capensis TaxID=884348 RepID=UPI002302B72B|nr:NADH dehydrogenase [ubiquinone] 1 alpha subcomplex assembly factor 2 isoform X3 [Hemicordylus capensis]
MSGGVWRLIRSLKLRALGPEKQRVGTDYLGNTYYRIPKHKTWAGHIIQERRFLEGSNIKEFEYEVGNIPTEWEAWIRKRRKDPPTIEEILKNANYKEELKYKVLELYEKERLQQAKEHEEGLVAEPIKIKGHASAHHYGKDEPSEDPVSTANTFQPGSWMPPQDSSRNK